MNLLLAALVWFPQFGGHVEVGHDVGLSEDLRGVIDLRLDISLVQGKTWRLDVDAGALSYVRENRKNETGFRISPEQIHSPVGLTLRLGRAKTAHTWALVARHQSNHDIDTSDPVLNRETISFEVYGVRLLGPAYRVEAGVYYDRGTRLDETQQNWPFNYFLAGLSAQGEWSPQNSWYVAGSFEFIAHRNAGTDLPYIDLGGHLDLGWQLIGHQGRGRGFLRYARVNNYQYLGDTPRHLLMLGVGIDSIFSQSTGDPSP